jgi:hypothetical protein
MESTQRGPPWLLSTLHRGTKMTNVVPNRYEGAIKKPRSYNEICFVLECGFWHSFFPFVTLSCASPKALHDRQYQLETLRDWFFVNKKYCTKGPAWSAIPIRNTKRLNFCEQNLQEIDHFKTFLRSGNFSGGCCLKESRYQTSLNFIQMITVTQWLVQ